MNTGNVKSETESGKKKWKIDMAAIKNHMKYSQKVMEFHDHE